MGSAVRLFQGKSSAGANTAPWGTPLNNASFSNSYWSRPNITPPPPHTLQITAKKICCAISDAPNPPCKVHRRRVYSGGWGGGGGTFTERLGHSVRRYFCRNNLRNLSFSSLLRLCHVRQRRRKDRNRKAACTRTTFGRDTEGKRISESKKKERSRAEQYDGKESERRRRMEEEMGW